MIDIRGNAGGLDQMVADMMASFYTKRSFYEYQSYLVPETGDSRSGRPMTRPAITWTGIRASGSSPASVRTPVPSRS